MGTIAADIKFFFSLLSLVPAIQPDVEMRKHVSVGQRRCRPNSKPIPVSTVHTGEVGINAAASAFQLTAEPVFVAVVATMNVCALGNEWQAAELNRIFALPRNFYDFI